MFATDAHGQTPDQLSVRLIPSQIMENTEGMLEVYSNTDGKSVDQLIATSSDSSIVEILGIVQDQNHLMTNIKIKAVSEGTANIALAAPGFTSQEFPITVYKNSNVPTALIIKTTPTTFTTTGPKQGYVSVELTNNDGFPMLATDDTTITLSTTNNDVVQLKSDNLIIKKGEYFGIGEFEINHQGDAQIVASSESMQSVSSTVSVSATTQQQMVQLYVFPKTINAFHASYAYAVVQLHDSSGNPVIATEDIPVSIQVLNTNQSSAVNTSPLNSLVQANGPLIIKRGSYWAYTPISVNAGVNSLFNVTISTKGYLVSHGGNITTVAQVCENTNHEINLGDCTNGALYDDKNAKVDLLPILATGQKELVGIMHLEDNAGSPVIANSNLSVPVDSSDPNTLSVDNGILNTGSQAGLVFGTPKFSNPVTLNVVTPSPQSLTPQIFSHVSEDLQIVADPIIPKILSHTDFPLSLYMIQNGAITYFPKDMTPSIAPTTTIQTKPDILSKGQSIVLLNSNLLNDGSKAISITTQDFSTNLSLTGLSSKPASIVLDYPDKILSNLKNTFSIEVLDEQKLPIFLTKDTEFKLVSNNPDALNVPESVVIKQGSYYSFFDVNTKNSGKSEISVLTDGLDMAKFDVDVTNLTPDVSISSSDYVDQNVVLNAKVLAQYNGVPLSQMKVDWQVTGGTIQKMDSMTDQDGNANISILAQDPTSVDIKANVIGGIYGTTTAEKSIKVNAPLGNAAGSSSNTNSFSMFGLNPLFIVIPVAAAAAGGIIVLKKKNMLEGLTEKVVEVKDRLSQMREK